MKKSSTIKNYPPLRVIRELLELSRAKFGELFGCTERYIEAVEYGEQPATESLIVEVSLHFGIEPDSLRRNRGCPRSLITGNKIRVTFIDPGTNSGEPIERIVSLNEFPSWRNASDEYERLAVKMALWQQYVICYERNHERIGEVLTRKMSLLLHAAAELDRYYSVTLNLDRWIEYTADTYQLRKRINELRLRMARAGENAEWPPFFEMLKDSFNLSPPKRRRRKR